MFRINFSSWTGLCYIRKSNRGDGVLKEELFKLELPPTRRPGESAAGRVAVMLGPPRRCFPAYTLATEPVELPPLSNLT